MATITQEKEATPINEENKNEENKNEEDKNEEDSEASPVRKRKRRLHGRAFYESIGSPKFILAPMVDQSEFAWRMLTRSFMTPTSNKSLLAYSPMLHARMFSETSKFRDAHLQPFRSSLLTYPTTTSSSSSPSPTKDLTPYLDGNPSIDRPLFIQFCANDSDDLLQAARFVTPFCDAVDLNLGCPQGIARKGHYGAFLQEDISLIEKLINNLHTNLDVPVTAKIRILEDRQKTLKYARRVVGAGASILTVHGRTRDMKGHKTGKANWSVIRYLRENLPWEVVMFANGNILQRTDLDDCLRETGVDGVMSAEGNLYDPGIFAEPPPKGQEGREYWRDKDGKKGGWRMDAVLRRYLDIIHKYVLEVGPPVRRPLFLPTGSSPSKEDQNLEEAEEEEQEGPPRKKQKKSGEKREKVTNPNLVAMQAHLFHLLRSLVSRHHNVRDALARCRVGDIAAFENVLKMVEKVVKEGISEYEATEGGSWAREEKEMEVKLKLLGDSGKQAGDAKGAENGGKANGSSQDDADTEDIEEEYESSVQTVRNCRRPWWVVQPYVRPLPKEALAKGSWKLSKKDRAKMEKGKEKGLEEVAMATSGDLLGEGRVAKESMGEGKEEVLLPKEGLVCG